MSIFGNILNRIFHTDTAGAARTAATNQNAPPRAPQTGAPAAPQASPAERSAAAPVNVEAVLTGLAAKKGNGGGNWRTSIVDLLKLLDMDSSLKSRKELAQELGVHAGEYGTAEQNIALQRAVWRELAKNGGHIPASLRD